MELKLVALDEDDLGIVSTHLQDSVVKIADIHWRPADKCLVMLLNRFDWEEATASHFQRRRTALRFERVRACQCRHVQPCEKDAVLNLLDVAFTPGPTAPAGQLTLTFSGGCAMRLEVECIEVELADLGPVWDTTVCPTHPDDLQADTL